MAFHHGDLCRGERKNPIFGGLLDVGSEVTLIPGDPECHCGPAVRV